MKIKSTIRFVSVVTAVLITMMSVCFPSPLLFVTAEATDAPLVSTADDPQTDSIEDGFSLVSEDDGKVSADKSVTYNADGYSAFSYYAEDEFSVELSALAQSYSVTEVAESSEYVRNHADVIFVVDVSSSMVKYTVADSEMLRAEATMKAINGAIYNLMETDPETRIGIVSFGNCYYDDGLYLPIDKYTLPEGDQYYVNYEQESNMTTAKIPDATEISSYTLPYEYDDNLYMYFDGTAPTVKRIYSKYRMRIASTGKCLIYEPNNSSIIQSFTLTDNTYNVITVDGVEYAIFRTGNKFTIYGDLQYGTVTETITKKVSSISTDSSSKTSVTLENGVVFKMYRSSSSSSAKIYVYRGTNSTLRATLTSSSPTDTYTYNSVKYTFKRTSSSSMTISYEQTETNALLTKEITVSEKTTGTEYRMTTSGCLKNSDGEILSATGYTLTTGSDGTFTQAGLKAAEMMFATVEDTENRVPVIVLVSDGEPTFWDNDYVNVPHLGTRGGDNEGDGTTDRGGEGNLKNCMNIMGYSTIRTAMSVKSTVDEMYPDIDAMFFSLGPGVSSQYGKTVLDPSEENLDACIGNTTAIDSYGNATADGLRTMLLSNLSQEELEYVDYADWSLTGELTMEEMEQGLKEIVAAVTDIPRPVTKRTETTRDGQILDDEAYVKFTDTYGDGMELRDSPIVRYAGVNYEATDSQTVETENGERKTIFTYNYAVKEESTGHNCNLKDILVYLFEEANGKQILEVFIPSSLLPTITPDIEVPESYKSATPIRIISKVGVRNYSDSSGIYYTNDIEDPATFEYTPVVGNPYYYDITTDDNGINHASWGGDIKLQTVEKTENSTETKSYSVSEEATDGTVCVSLGNNGKISIRRNEIHPDTVVIDYGLPVSISVLANDVGMPTDITINSIGTGQNLSCNTQLEEKLFDTSDTISMENGIVCISDSGTKVTYTPTNATMSNEEVFYYEIFSGGKYYYGKVTVIPATNIYYEDSFFTFSDSAGYCWKTEGETYNDAKQAEDRPGMLTDAEYDANNVYGRDSVYDDETVTYSLGSAMKVTVDALTGNNGPSAEFTFCGTGFDLFSVTTNKSGVAIVKVQSLTSGINYSKQYIINTYYGYSYGRLYLKPDGTVTVNATQETDGTSSDNAPLYETDYEPGYISPDKNENVVTVNGKVYSDIPFLFSDAEDSWRYAYGWIGSGDADAEENGLYQIPVVSIPTDSETGLTIPELEYGTYKVTVIPKYTPAMDKTGCGEYTFCIDGIRIYNPAGKNDSISDTVAEAYEQDSESNPQYTEIRDVIIADADYFTKTINTDEYSSVSGALFIDGITALCNDDTTTALNKLRLTGPNNEIYLSDGQAMSFSPVVYDCLSYPASVQIGMKVTNEWTENGGNATVKVIISDRAGTGIETVKTFKISGSAEQYYDISEYLTWTEDTTEENRYICDNKVILLNDSDSIVSLTSLKWTYIKEENQSYSAPTPMLSFVSDSDTLGFVRDSLVSVYETADTTEIKLSWLSDQYEKNATVRLEITTPEEITSVFVGDVEITDCSTADGVKVWTIDLTVDETEEQTYTISVYDSRGRTGTLNTIQPVITVNGEDGTTTDEKSETEQVFNETEDETEEVTDLNKEKEPESNENDLFNELVKLLKKIINALKALIRTVIKCKSSMQNRLLISMN